jgi:NADH-quinone oxidoreductase subunit M
MRWIKMFVQVLPLWATISPFLGIISVVIAARLNRLFIRPTAIFSAVLTLLLLLATAGQYDPHQSDQPSQAIHSQMETRVDGHEQAAMSPLGLNGLIPIVFDGRLTFGIDGLTLWPCLWIALAVCIATLSPHDRSRESIAHYVIALLFAEGTLLASLTIQQMIFPLLCFEASLPALYFLIGRCGQKDRRRTAGQFLIYQMVGGTLTILGMTLVVVSWPWIRRDFDGHRAPVSFAGTGLIDSIPSLVASNEIAVAVWSDVAPWAFAMLSLGLAIRLPIFPFHSWYVKTLVEASPGVAGLISVALPQVAFCGWVRCVMPLFLQQTLDTSWLLGIAASVGVLHAGVMSLGQTDLRCLGASLSMSCLALAALAMRLPDRSGLAGAFLLVQSQGLSMMILLLLISRFPSRISNQGGDSFQSMAVQQPRLAAMLIVSLLGMGLCGIGGAAGTLVSFVTLTEESIPFAVCGIAAALMTTVATITNLQSVLLGRNTSRSNSRVRNDDHAVKSRAIATDNVGRSSNSTDTTDLTRQEFLVISVIIGLMAWFTLAPQAFLKSGESSLSRLLKRYEFDPQARDRQRASPVELDNN